MSGAGRDGEVDLLVYPMIRQFWQFTSTLLSKIWLHARLGKQTWRAVKPSFTTHFASRNGFRFLAPGSRLCFLSFHPSPPFSSTSCAFRTLTFRHFLLHLPYLCCPCSPGLPKPPSFPPPAPPPKKRAVLKCRLRFLLEWAQKKFIV